MSTIGQGLSQWIEAGLRSKEKLDKSNSLPLLYLQWLFAGDRDIEEIIEGDNWR